MMQHVTSAITFHLMDYMIVTVERLCRRNFIDRRPQCQKQMSLNK